ncbi:uncharacterized protein UV8b_00900 [Ustilaginoidea virens]|uniref:Pyridoxamine 5'-phosphate oxidase Alr4036 family FMN-binding domain-containing protein n=1 Tax=Ustilaginoidea virens TaxID=1159556 RepID=A0A063C629_USTVR|nr:uncharacterized protein UV8b_00900 [Ustilaginoidea virens]QUC16659.1 hypothetical protein UV8b_00900 [Ustilaginoidea virens]GAO20177.1 hypothetical protein UVI_02043020 [Ustilaginoidea virens]
MATAAAPWRDAFTSDLESMKSPTFTLSSLHRASSPSSPQTPQFLPRARTVVYRGMWASLQPNSKNKNPAPLNPSHTYETDLPTCTTDVRMEKVGEMLDSQGTGRSSSGGGKASASASASSRVGGPIEAVFWVPDRMTQWRLRGHVCMVGPDIDSDRDVSVREHLAPYMRPVRGNVASWSWSRELTAHFGNLSPLMRGSFRNPPPGTPLSSPAGCFDGLGLGQEVDDLDDDVARKNFRVLIIVPAEVDKVDLSDAKKGRRWNYLLERTVGGDEVWKVTELWP